MNKKYKWCWLATEVKGGWRLKLFCNDKEYNLTGAIFTTIKEIETITSGKNGKIVFVHLKNTRFPLK